MNIVLYQPEIPQNTGNISRTCALTETTLHLIKPLGFSLDEKHLKRAGLDYWDLLDLHVYESFDDFIKKNPEAQIYLLTTKAESYYDAIAYDENAYLMFGKETAGLPESLLAANKEHCMRIPMIQDARSLNLSNSVAVVLYEALRQQEFPGLF